VKKVHNQSGGGQRKHHTAQISKDSKAGRGDFPAGAVIGAGRGKIGKQGNEAGCSFSQNRPQRGKGKIGGLP